ncbi:hypothetical protein BRADI_4g17393v3 [Brachypodium distachyon]|uniref:Uncharacterized protein n=1 Tax=Brachypodium distachyon TaxID=15368 RepID=A0A0Q3EPY8_BRADI|nr:hypothetical protein BRADI_4g17393v3 [Brachypodium distachyon]
MSAFGFWCFVTCYGLDCSVLFVGFFVTMEAQSESSGSIRDVGVVTGDVTLGEAFFGRGQRGRGQTVAGVRARGDVSSLGRGRRGRGRPVAGAQAPGDCGVSWSWSTWEWSVSCGCAGGW